MKKITRIKKIFWMDWGTFFGTTMVCCGWKDYAEVKDFLKKKKYNGWLTAMNLKSDEFKTNHFSRWHIEEVETGRSTSYSILWLKDWKPDLEHYKILAHELLHAVQFCMPDFLDVEKEYEAVAYQHSYLFEKAAKELNS